VAERGATSNWSALLLASLLVVVGGWIAERSLVIPKLLACAGLAAAGFVVAAMALRRSSGLLVFSGVIVGLVSAMLVSGWAVLFGIIGFAVLVALPSLEESSVLASAATALLGSSPLMYGALAIGRPAAGLLPWLLAAWIELVRQLIVRGQRRIIAIVLLLALVTVSLVIPGRAGYGGAYYLIVLFAELLLLGVATRMIVGRSDRLNLLMKGAMALGLAALVAGRVI
jgi:hypothetical protein